MLAPASQAAWADQGFCTYSGPLLNGSALRKRLASSACRHRSAPYLAGCSMGGACYSAIYLCLSMCCLICLAVCASHSRLAILTGLLVQSTNAWLAQPAAYLAYLLLRAQAESTVHLRVWSSSLTMGECRP